MDGVKGFAEIFEHLLYELLGLLVPGAVMLLLLASVWSSTSWEQALALADRSPWLAVGSAYVTGYVVQGISRPVTTFVDALLQVPALAATEVIGLLHAPVRDSIRRQWERLCGALTKRHSHLHGPEPDGLRVDFRVLARNEWTRRLGVPDGQVLSDGQVRDLSFSAMLGNLGRLDRFRSATSLARGTAAASAVTLGILSAQLLSGGRPATVEILVIIAALVLSFVALLSRADFYDRLWREVLLPQFLAQSGAAEPWRNSDSE